MSIAKTFLMVAAVSGMLAVILGAFGAHGLKSSLSASSLSTWQTAVQYQFYHTLALMLVALASLHLQQNIWFTVSGCLLITGLCLFSGSLYALALGGPRWLGPVTPLGGLMFILGWAALFVALLKSKI